MNGFMNPTAALIIIGNEILSGRTQDKNIAHIAITLNEIGVELREVRVIPDVESAIITTVNAMRGSFDYIFTTGGIGPTHDDITSASVAKAFGVALLRHPEAERLLRAYIPPERMNEARLRMADVPEGATLIPNAVSAAPGFIIGNVHVMAGVPNIMQAMLAAVIPTLRRGKKVESVSITTTVLEGTLAKDLTEIQARYPEMDIGSYPRFVDGRGITTLVFRSTDTSKNSAAAEEACAMILALGGEILPEPAAA
jgi:molybdenum cofactor synthesis domain-containing protein